jgi:hypothetical protein
MPTGERRYQAKAPDLGVTIARDERGPETRPGARDVRLAPHESVATVNSICSV